MELEKLLKNKMNREILKYAAGAQMFCPGCKEVLDWKTTVVIDVRKDDKHVTSVIVCESCFSQPHVAKNIQKFEADDFVIEITKYENDE